MDEVIWVEVLSRHGSVLARHRCTGRGIRIGRAYTNDVMLDDAYVAPEHAHIVRDETGRLLVEDLGTANGIFAEHGRKRLDRLALDGDSVFRLGQTFLRVRGAGEAVAPERQLGIRTRRLPAIAALFLTVVLGETLALWLRDYSEPQAETYVVPLLGGLILVGGWSGLWSLISRVFAGSARFEQNLLIALAGVLGLELTRAVSAVTAFGFAWSMLGRYAVAELLC
ncbi:MAG: FHA domain-containing protein, partial [Stellaceae bacterium]